MMEFDISERSPFPLEMAVRARGVRHRSSGAEPGKERGTSWEVRQDYDVLVCGEWENLHDNHFLGAA